MTCRLLVSQKAFPQRDVLSCAQDEHRTGQEPPPGQRRGQLCFLCRFVEDRKIKTRAFVLLTGTECNSDKWRFTGANKLEFETEIRLPR